MLPNEFIPYYCESLTRVGSKYDGGYLIDKNSLADVSKLISFGINDNWDFEKQLFSQNKISVDAYDYSVGLITWIKAFLRPLLKQRDILNAIRSLSLGLQFYKFFSGDNNFHKLKIGDGSFGSTSLTQVFAANDGIFFLKVDIEGWEYRILDQIINHQNLIRGLVIEFHDVDLHIERILKFLNDLNLSLVHIHANTVAGVNADGIPHVLEMSFSNIKYKSRIKDFQRHDLDNVNAKNNLPIDLVFNE